MLLIEAIGRCPPEECGGPPGCERLLEILAYPNNNEHDATLTWCGGPFNPTRADVSTPEAAVGLLARRWTPRKRTAAKTKA